MGMSISQKEWTVEMLDALPDDGKRYEVIDGVLFVTPAPAKVHQRAIGELYLLLAPYAKPVGIEVLFAPSAVRWSARREVQPDLFAAPLVPDASPAERFTDAAALLLAVEALSPRTRRTDRTVKRDLYQNENVPEYWIIDTTARSIDRWTPPSATADRLTSQLIWQPVAEFPPLIIDLPAYFREVHRERSPQLFV